MVVSVGGFQHPFLNLFSAGSLGYLVFRCYLFGVFHVAVLVNLPGTCPVRLPHTGRDLVFILAAVHQNQGHAVGLAAGLIDHGKAVMGQHGAGALAGQHPV